MKIAEIQAATDADFVLAAARKEGVDLVASFQLNTRQLERLNAEVKAQRRASDTLTSEIASLNTKKGVATRELAKRVRETEASFADELSRLKDRHGIEVAQAETEFAARKEQYAKNMAEFSRRENEARGLAEKAEKRLERLRRDIAA